MRKREQMDRIILKNMSFYGYVGVLQEEKINGQTFEIDLTLSSPEWKACDTDLLSQTVNYAEVYQLIEQIMHDARFDLIERLAGFIADKVLAKFHLISQVSVTIRKPMAPVQGQFDYMGVSICRERG